jgi:hypothetical protein
MHILPSVHPFSVETVTELKRSVRSLPPVTNKEEKPGINDDLKIKFLP